MIVIIDYGMGNVGSIRNMIAAVGGESIITSDLDLIRNADKVILPGVGAFDAGMKSLAKPGLMDAIESSVVGRRVPTLGICLGMQLMCNSSAEGRLRGLGWIDAEIRRFEIAAQSDLKIPHMGWNTLRVKKESPLFSGSDGEQRFYFVHSFHAHCNVEADVLATASHGYEFHAAFSSGNLYGVQFHPEKSHRFGKLLMSRFVGLQC
jgi:glutamine amidotransferase